MNLIDRPAVEPAPPEALALLQAAFPADPESGLLKLAALRMGPALRRLLEAQRVGLALETARLESWAEQLRQNEAELDAWDNRLNATEARLASWELTLRGWQATDEDTTPGPAGISGGLDRLNLPGPARVAWLVVTLLALAACAGAWWAR